MSFEVSGDAYDRFMGRYSRELAPVFADFAGVEAGQRVVDVGCGSGVLTEELARRVGADHVAGADPSPLLRACAQRVPGADLKQASAESLPWPDDSFDAALAQLVVHFMDDSVAGLREMARVTRVDGVVAACVWDHAGGQGPLSLFWATARRLDPGAADESKLAGAREGHLAELFRAAGLWEVEESVLSVSVEHQSFEEWWEPFELGVGLAGAYLAGLDEERQAELRELCRELLPAAPFAPPARAWAARGLA